MSVSHYLFCKLQIEVCTRFVKVAKWICQTVICHSYYIYFFKLLHVLFFALPDQTKLKFVCFVLFVENVIFVTCGFGLDISFLRINSQTGPKDVFSPNISENVWWNWSWTKFFAAVEFVTKVTSDTCVKYFWADVNLSRINACKICEICRLQAKVFT